MSDVNPFNAGPGELSIDRAEPGDYCAEKTLAHWRPITPPEVEG